MTTQTITLPTECQRILDNPSKYAVIDTEIAGPRYGGEVCDLAIASPDGTVLFSKLLRPKCPIDPETSAFHGITNEMVATATTFAEEWDEICQHLDGKIIIAYNADFDKGRMWHTSREHGFTPRHTWIWQCMMKKYAQFWGMPGKYGEFAWQKLQDACDQQGIPIMQEHRALSDTLAVVKLIQRLAELGDEARRYSAKTEV